MLSKKEIKDIQSLHDKKARDAAGLFVAEGPKIAAELALHAPHQIVQMYATVESIVPYEVLKKFASEISHNLLLRIAQTKTPAGVITVARKFDSVEPIITSGICLYLDGIQDPGNLGTIIRTADWFGLKNIVCSAACADAYNSKTIQSTMGSIMRVNVWVDAHDNWLSKQRVPLFAATLQGETTFSKAHTGILIIGNESQGVRKELLQQVNRQLTIARVGKAESLNAAVATGILLSQLLSETAYLLPAARAAQ